MPEFDRNNILAMTFYLEQIGASHRIAGWSSLVARKAHNLEVARSNRAPATSALTRHHTRCSVSVLVLP